VRKIGLQEGPDSLSEGGINPIQFPERKRRKKVPVKLNWALEIDIRVLLHVKCACKCGEEE